MTPAVIITGWQVLGGVCAVILALGLTCLGLGLWAHYSFPHDLFDEDTHHDGG